MLSLICPKNLEPQNFGVPFFGPGNEAKLETVEASLRAKGTSMGVWIFLSFKVLELQNFGAPRNLEPQKIAAPKLDEQLRTKAFEIEWEPRTEQ